MTINRDWVYNQACGLSHDIHVISYFLCKVSKEAKIRNRYNQVPHLTQDTTRESDRITIKHHSQESQEVSPFPAGDHKVTMNRQESMT